MSLAIPQASTDNILLRLLSEDDFGLLCPHLTRVDLALGDGLFAADSPIEWVYFPEMGVASIVAPLEEGIQIEVGLFGREGMSGTPVLLGTDRIPYDSMLQVGPGRALRLPADRLREACRESPGLHADLLRYVQVFTIQTAQTGAVNARYALPERLARWLLMCHDRMDGDILELTHQFMAMMLGVRRSGVTVTLHTLEETGAIRASRGQVRVTDRERLEDIAGDAYGRAEGEYNRLIAPFGKRTARPD